MLNSVEIHIKSPTPFIVENWKTLLPGCKVPPQTLVLVLLKAQFPLNREGELIKAEKDRLLSQFLEWGKSFYLISQQQGLFTEIISPQDGTPQYSKRGETNFDLVAVIHHLLGFNFSQTGKGCKVLEHPVWQAAVYPGIFLSEATGAAIEPILTAICRA
jgi:hypothetical protein